jgi:hypothetical protein
MPPRPKYQVFISSTYSDLREEREAVTWAILTARHIPVGMEAFTATDDRGWRTIKSAIDRSDYYVLLLAGRYGSVDRDGKSWTEKEYDYAVSQGVPILIFPRSRKFITADQLDDDPTLATKLEALKARVNDKHLCVEWREKDDLVARVSEALKNQMTDDEDNGNARPGWYRGSEIPKAETLDEFARLSSETERLRSELDSLRASVNDAPSLALAERQQIPVSGTYKSVRAFKTYHNAITSLEKAKSDKWADKYLALNTMTVFELSVRNVSRSLVEHVVLDLAIGPIEGFLCGWSGNELKKRGGRLENNTVKPEYKKSYPSEVRLEKSDEVLFRFRVERIAAGATEYIPPLFVLGAVGQDRAYFNLRYLIAGSAGSPVSGECDYEIEFNSSEEVGEKGYKEDERALRKYREVIIPGDYFLYDAL